MKKTIWLLIGIFILSGCGKNRAVISKKENLVFDVYSTIKESDLVSITDGFLIEDKEIYLEEIGKKEINIVYQDNYKHKGSYTISIEVIDTVEPILSMSSHVYKKIGDSYNLCDMAFFGDNYDRYLDCQISGEYDKDKVGEYKLKMQVTDQSKNQTSKDFSLHIVKSFSNGTSSNTEGFKIEEAVATAQKNTMEVGIDVSSHQGVIDWQKVKNAGVTFAMIRLGYGYTTNMELILDKYFQENLIGAKNAGLKVGVYFYSYANTIEEVEQQAEFIADSLNGQTLELGVAYDFENWQKFYNYHINFNDLNKMYKAFKKKINSFGYDCLLYGSKYYLNHVWDTDNETVWLAHYTNKTDYSNPYKIWQFTSVGLVDGIHGFVDLDFLYQ